MYAAPEVGAGDQQYDYGADIWSAGGVLVYLLFKHHPFSTHWPNGRLLSTAELDERKRQLNINWPAGARRSLRFFLSEHSTASFLPRSAPAILAAPRYRAASMYSACHGTSLA